LDNQLALPSFLRFYNLFSICSEFKLFRRDVFNLTLLPNHDRSAGLLGPLNDFVSGLAEGGICLPCRIGLTDKLPVGKREEMSRRIAIEFGALYR